MTARMVRSHRSHGRKGYRRMAVVDCLDGCSEEDEQRAAVRGINSRSDNKLAVCLWTHEMPAKFFSPQMRDAMPEEQADQFLYWWNRGEEIAWAFNQHMAYLESRKLNKALDN